MSDHHEVFATGTASDGLPVDLFECGLCHEEWPCRAHLRAEVERLRGELATESAERIRCRDGWRRAGAQLAQVESLLDDALTVLGAPGMSSDRAKRDLAKKMRAALAAAKEKP